MARSRYALLALMGLLIVMPAARVRATSAAPAAISNVHVNVDARSTGKPFPHFWEEAVRSWPCATTIARNSAR